MADAAEQSLPPFSAREAEFYDSIYASKDYDAEARIYSRLIGGPQRARDVLDFGCGTGGFATRLAALGHAGEILGCDPSPAMVDLARAKGVRVICAHMHDLAKGTKFAFDAACAPFSVLCYAGAAKPGLHASLVNARRCLKRGAVFAADVINAYAVCLNLRRSLVREARGTSGDREYTLLRRDSREFSHHDSILSIEARFRVNWDDAGSPPETFISRHAMRVYSPMEIKAAVEAAGFVAVRTLAMDGVRDQVGPSDWHFLVVGEVPR